MNKKIRKAVRTYLIEDNKVVVIKYNEHDKGYYDMPVDHLALTPQ